MARPRQVTDEAIFTAVREAVAEHGHAVPTTVIASMCGLSQAALFKRFGTKEALLVRGLSPNPPVELFQLFAGGPTPERPFREQLHELATRIHRMMRETMPRIHALRAAGYEPKNVFKHFDVPPPVMALRALDSWFGVAQERGLIQADVNTYTLAKALLGTMFFDSHLDQLLGDWLEEDAPEAYVTRIVGLLCDGMMEGA